jgi:hypothetical protein
MATLPTTAFQLHGGCFCSAIRYTISVPELASRPIIPQNPTKPFGPQSEVNEHLPIISLDHCNSCRRTSGVIVQSWFICPQSWVGFTLRPRSQGTSGSAETIKPATIDLLKPDASLLERTFVTGFKSSENKCRTFCGKCGTHLTFLNDRPNHALAEKGNWGPYFDVVVGTLDKESLEMDGLRPYCQVWSKDGIEWVKRLVLEGEKSLFE